MPDVPLTESMYYILLVLHEPSHGYRISQRTEELTGGRVRLGPGTLYGALQTLLARGWVRVCSQQEDSRKKKVYALTEEGRAVFSQELNRLEEAIGNAEEAGLC